MPSGDVVRIDFGVPAGSEPGFVRPAVIVTADAVLQAKPRTVHVVPVTSNVARDLPTDIAVVAAGLTLASVAQCHLCTVASTERLLDDGLGSVGASALAQIRVVLGDLLDIG